MSAARLLKLLLFAASAAAGYAVLTWYQSGWPPPSWLTWLATIAFMAAVVVGLVGAETRPRLMLRFVAALMALLGVIALAADIALPKPDGAHSASFSLLEHLQSVSPSLVVGLEGRITQTFGETAWNPVLTTLLGLPAYLIFFVLAALLGFAGRPRHTVRVYIN